MNIPNWAPPQGHAVRVNPRTMALLDTMLLDDKGRIKLLPAAVYHGIEHQDLRTWANLRCQYGFPTLELVSWLKDFIAGRKAIEIGAGNGNLGIHLGITMTDSYQQVDDPETVAYFALHNIPAIRPPADVEKEDAENAVRRRKPQVVVACYVTEKFDPKTSIKGNSKGVRYDYIIERCETFILIGNETVHGKNKALALPHTKFHFPWLITRSEKPELNRIWVWDNKK